MSTIQEDASKNFKIADYIQFGNYPQTLHGDIKPIEWQILLIEDNKMFVISKYGLEAKRFDGSSNDWKKSEIRQWLNDYFYNKAFNFQEKKYIKPFNLSDVGTIDKIFLLSQEEAEKYFSNNKARKCKSTGYAKKNGAWVADSSWGDNAGYSWWWLRSPCPIGTNDVYFVFYSGRLGNCNSVCDNRGVVRPALWIEF